MPGQKKERSRRLSKPPVKLVDEVKLWRQAVIHLEENGQKDTAAHTTLARLEKALSKYSDEVSE